MPQAPSSRILARAEPADLIGRVAHLKRLMSLARGERAANGLVVLAAPSAGASELLRQAFDRLFAAQAEIVPFYFEIKPTDRTAQGVALRFLCEFLIQTVAFRRREPSIIAASPAVAEIAELAEPVDGLWIDRLVN